MNPVYIDAAQRMFTSGQWWGHPSIIPDEDDFLLMNLVMCQGEDTNWRCIKDADEDNTWLLLVCAAVTGDEDFSVYDYEDGETLNYA